jgi:phosphate transport system protein
MTEHTVTAFEEELQALDSKIAQMGGLAEQLLGRAIDALEKRDPDLALKTIQQDEQIDRLEREVEEMAVSIIARRQPVALDLRQIMTAISARTLPSAPPPSRTRTGRASS